MKSGWGLGMGRRWKRVDPARLPVQGQQGTERVLRKSVALVWTRAWRRARPGRRRSGEWRRRTTTRSSLPRERASARTRASGAGKGVEAGLLGHVRCPAAAAGTPAPPRVGRLVHGTESPVPNTVKSRWLLSPTHHARRGSRSVKSLHHE